MLWDVGVTWVREREREQEQEKKTNKETIERKRNWIGNRETLRILDGDSKGALQKWNSDRNESKWKKRGRKKEKER